MYENRKNVIGWSSAIVSHEKGGVPRLQIIRGRDVIRTNTVGYVPSPCEYLCVEPLARPVVCSICAVFCSGFPSVDVAVSRDSDYQSMEELAA